MRCQRTSKGAGPSLVQVRKFVECGQDEASGRVAVARSWRRRRAGYDRTCARAANTGLRPAGWYTVAEDQRCVNSSTESPERAAWCNGRCVRGAKASCHAASRATSGWKRARCRIPALAKSFFGSTVSGTEIRRSGSSTTVTAPGACSGSTHAAIADVRNRRGRAIGATGARCRPSARQARVDSGRRRKRRATRAALPRTVDRHVPHHSCWPPLPLHSAPCHVACTTLIAAAERGFRRPLRRKSQPFRPVKERLDGGRVPAEPPRSVGSIGTSDPKTGKIAAMQLEQDRSETGPVSRLTPRILVVP